MMTCFTLLGSLLLFAVNTVAYMCGPITAAKVLPDDRFPPTPAEVAKRLTSQQSKVLASASSDILVYVDYGTIVVQRGAIVSNLFELRGDYEVVFLSDLKLGVIVIDTRLEFLRFDSEFRNVRTFACDLPPSSWQYGRQLFLGGGSGVQGSTGSALLVLESNRTDPPTSFDRVVTVSFSVDPLNLDSPPVMGAVTEIAETIYFPNYRLTASMQRGKLVEWRQNWSNKKSVDLFVDRRRWKTLNISSARDAVLLPGASGNLMYPDKGTFGLVGVITPSGQHAFKRVQARYGATSSVMIDDKASRLYWPTSGGIWELSTCPNDCQTLDDIDAWNTTNLQITNSSNSRLLTVVTLGNAVAPVPLRADACEKIAQDQCSCNTECRTCNKAKAMWVENFEGLSDRFHLVDSCLSADSGSCFEETFEKCATVAVGRTLSSVAAQKEITFFVVVAIGAAIIINI